MQTILCLPITHSERSNHEIDKIGSTMEKQSYKWLLVAGARPNFVKVAPLIRAIRSYNDLHENSIQPYLVHTGQHYDLKMSDSFFNELNLPKPDINLGIGSGTHGEQTGKILIEFEKVLFTEKPGLVVVVGDVNSTLACALASAKLHIPIAHVEAGLRSFDRSMPEEINRMATDVLSDYLFTPSPDADKNLHREGIPPEKIFLVGDIMVDSLLFHIEQAKGTNILERLGLKDRFVSDYCLLTLHRPSNVDNKKSLSRIFRGLVAITSMLPVLFPVHPRTRKQLEQFGMESTFDYYTSADLRPEDYYEKDGFKRKIHCFEPLGYLDFLNLMAHAKVVLTDSGGIQVETSVLNVPCITLRDTTERPCTLDDGANVLVKDDPERIVWEVRNILNGNPRKRMDLSMWDGHTAERIVKILVEKLNSSRLKRNEG